MSKAVISPLLKSIIKKTDKYPYLGVTMDEVESLIESLSGVTVGKVNISHYVAAKSARVPNICLTGAKDYTEDVVKVQEVLVAKGFKVVKSFKNDSGSWRVNFVRK